MDGKTILSNLQAQQSELIHSIPHFPLKRMISKCRQNTGNVNAYAPGVDALPVAN
jgi:hypothetical protein